MQIEKFNFHFCLSAYSVQNYGKQSEEIIWNIGRSVHTTNKIYYQGIRENTYSV